MLDENLKTNFTITGCTDSEPKRRGTLEFVNALRTAYDLLYNEVQPKTKVADLRNVLVRIPGQINYNEDAQNEYLRVCYGDEIRIHNKKVV